MSSQATVVLHYAMDNDEDANAFDRSADSADDLTLTEEALKSQLPRRKRLDRRKIMWIQDPFTVRSRVDSRHGKESGGDAKRIDEFASNLQTPAASPPSSKDPVSPTEPSGHYPRQKSIEARHFG
ncbi:hypothetical protein GQ600_23074 [Phytophthora cactorum]|nr:hypothetical protein GQ600_23074 [Phytophthora cactorum]